MVAKRTKKQSDALQVQALPPADKSVKNKGWIILLLVLVCLAAIRLRWLDIPLERDEGEYAYMGQLMLEGIPPYQLAYNMKLPGTYAFYALVLGLLGNSVASVHLGLLLANAAAVVLLFILVRRLYDWQAGALAAAVYVLFSTSPAVMGTAAHATQFMAPLALGGLVLLIKAVESRRLLWLLLSGLLMGTALLMKQHGIFLVPVGLVVWYLHKKENSPLVAGRALIEGTAYFFTAALPLLAVCILLYLEGVFGSFWFWCIEYAREYVARVSFSQGMGNLLRAATMQMIPTLGLWLFSLIGLTALWWDPKACRWKSFILIWGVGTFLTACPGRLFRDHYWVVFLTWVAGLAGIGFRALQLLLVRRKQGTFATYLLGILMLAAILHPIARNWRLYFSMTPDEVSRFIYPMNPFVETVEIAKHIRTDAAPSDRLAVLGSEPQLYFYTGLKSATGYIYTYPLMENHPLASRMQKEMIAEIEASKPAFIVMVQHPLSWLANSKSEDTIIIWAGKYLEANYEVTGLAEISPGSDTVYRWGSQTRNYVAKSPYLIYVYHRGIVSRF